MKKIYLLFAGLLLTSIVFAQSNSTNFQVLQVVSPARLAALGGYSVAVKDGDLSFGSYTPSLLDSTVDRQLSLGYSRLFGEAGYSHLAYGMHLKNVGTFAVLLQNISYGNIDMTDERGNVLGSFSAGEYLFQVGYGRQLDSLFSVGANVKFVFSELAEYKASALALDLAGTYYNPQSEFTATVALKNAGVSLSHYTSQKQEMPFEIQAGLSKKLLKAPLRLGVTFADLQQWDLTPDTGAKVEIDPLTGEEIEKDNQGFGENLVRHLIFNAEVLITQNLNLRFGYNFNRRKQLAHEDRPGAGGITYGLGLRIAKFHLSYGRETYNLAGSTNHFTVAVKFDDFTKVQK